MNGWKILSIFLIVTNVLTLLFIGWVWNLGSEMMMNEQRCAYEICENSPSYSYDDWDNVCYCFENGEVVHQEYMG